MIGIEDGTPITEAECRDEESEGPDGTANKPYRSPGPEASP